MVITDPSFGHTPPVTQEIAASIEDEVPGSEKLVHGTANNNISSRIQENIPFPKNVPAEAQAPKPKTLSSSISASPKSTPAQVLQPLQPLPLPKIASPTTKNPYAVALTATSCPGTWGTVFTPFIEREPNSATGMMNPFQHMSFSESFQKYSQEELRLSDYAIFVCLVSLLSVVESDLEV